MSGHVSGRLSGRLCGRESDYVSGHAQDCVSHRVFGEKFRLCGDRLLTREQPFADNLHVVVGHSQDHNSSVGVADRRPPWGVPSNKERAKVEVEV